MVVEVVEAHCLPASTHRRRVGEGPSREPPFLRERCPVDRFIPSCAVANKANPTRPEPRRRRLAGSGTWGGGWTGG